MGTAVTGRRHGDGAPLRIGILAPPWIPVPPERYGGVEWIVSILAETLTSLGHDVTLFASGDSATQARLVSAYPTAPTELAGRTEPELLHVLTALVAAEGLDIVNDHSGMLAPALAASCPVPLVHTVHRPLDAAYGEIYRMIARLTPQVGLISLSASQRSGAPDLPWIGNCANAIDLDAYPAGRLRRDDFLFFVGRLSEDRGAAEAIDVAEALGAPLVIAGSIDRSDPAYFEERVAPRLSKTIRYAGEVTHAEKIDLLGRARCSIFPLTFPEPFGFLILESLACGTPVVALRSGAVAELIVDGEVGFICEDVADMPAAVEACSTIDGAACRAYVIDRYSEVRMAREYLAIYRRFLAQAPVTA